MSSFVLGLAIGELACLAIVAWQAAGHALEALGMTAIWWSAVWTVVFAGLAWQYSAAGWTGRGPIIALGLVIANAAMFRIAAAVDKKYGGPA